MKLIWILVLDGVMDSSLAITLDTLRAAQSFAARRGISEGQVRFLVLGARARVRTGAGLQLAVDSTFKTMSKGTEVPDWVIVPALGEHSDLDIHAHFAQADALQAMLLLRKLANNRVKMAASCSAVFLLAQADLLSKKTVTTTWWLASVFRKRYPNVSVDEARMLVRDGLILTAGAGFSQLDLVLAVITEAQGATVADLCARYLLIDRRPSQARYMVKAHLHQSDPLMVLIERWIDNHLSVAITVQALSRALAITPKTLARRVQAATGLSPIKLIQRRRLTLAAQLLETTRMSVEEVAAQVGYQDSTALRRLIKRDMGVTPGALRERGLERALPGSATAR